MTLHTSPSGGKPRFSRAFLIALGILGGLVIAEIVLRLSGFSFALFPSRIQFGWPDPVALKESFQIDRDLLWVQKDYDARRQAWQARRLDIVFQGCSCTEFGGYPEHLAGLLTERHPGKHLAWANAAVAGWSSYQGLKQLQRDILPLKPLAVSMLFGWNDHWATFGIEDKDIGAFNLDHSTLVIGLADLRLAQALSLLFFRTSPTLRRLSERRPERVSLTDFSANLTAMVRLAKANGITPVLLTAPANHQEGHEPPAFAHRMLNRLGDLVPLHQRYVKTVRTVAASESALLIDLEERFRGLPAPTRDACFQTDGLHFSATGGLTAAGFLYEGFEQAGLFRPALAR